METVLSAESLTKRFGELLVFEDISFYLRGGEVVSLLGPSGCGKSTILQIISGLLVPDRGEVYLKGRRITGLTGEMSYLQQKDLLLPWRKIIDNVSLPLQIQGMSKKRARHEAAPFFVEFGLEGFESVYPSQLSGGMRQRAALLRTYLFSREVLLLDEPFARLDAVTTRKLHIWFKNVMQRLKSTVLFITHDIDEALHLSDRIYLLSPRPARIMREVDVASAIHSRENLKEEILSLLETSSIDQEDIYAYNGTF